MLQECSHDIMAGGAGECSSVQPGKDSPGPGLEDMSSAVDFDDASMPKTHCTNAGLP